MSATAQDQTFINLCVTDWDGAEPSAPNKLNIRFLDRLTD